MGLITYPLRFFNASAPAQMIMQSNPGSVLDATMPPGLLMPLCVACNTGEGILREEKEALFRYRCVICGFETDWGDRDMVAQQWANCNDPNIPTNLI